MTNATAQTASGGCEPTEAVHGIRLSGVDVNPPRRCMASVCQVCNLIDSVEGLTPPD